MTLPPAGSHCPGWPFSQDIHGGPLGPRCSFIVCVYDSSSSPVLSLKLGQLDVGPLELILPSQPYTFTFPAVESVSYFFTL